MERFLTCAQAREIDRRAVIECGMSSLVLMENAARGVLDVLERQGIAGPVLICCGRGNNGGDGLALARLLDVRGCAVSVALWGEDSALSADASANLGILRHCDVRLERFEVADEPDRLARLIDGADWIVDALFGTGFRGEMRAPFDMVVRQLNAACARRLAVDVPSGLNADTGHAAEHTFRADHTVTFVAPKVGFQAPEAGQYLGQIHVADSGAPRRLVEEALGARSGVRA